MNEAVMSKSANETIVPFGISRSSSVYFLFELGSMSKTRLTSHSSWWMGAVQRTENSETHERLSET